MLIVFPGFYWLPTNLIKWLVKKTNYFGKRIRFYTQLYLHWGAGLPGGKSLWNGAGLGRYVHLNHTASPLRETRVGRKKPGAVNPALCVLTLPCFFLWIRFLLCWAFLFSRLILFGFGCLFRHTIKFKFSELFIHGCSVFLPVLPCCPFRSGNCTARI